MREKMSDDMKLKICLEAKKIFYKEDKDKDYSKNTLHKLKSQIKSQLEKKSLDWELQKNLLYWIEGVGIDGMNNILKLKSDHYIEIRKKDNQIKILNNDLFGTRECIKAERINMRDTIKKQYEQEFIEKYRTENFKQLEEENNYLRKELYNLRTLNNKEVHKVTEHWENKFNSLQEQYTTLLQDTQKEKVPETPTSPTDNKCKKCKKYKKENKELKKENLKLQTILLKYEGDSSSSSSDSDSE
tara:strand:- start:7727 stop:8455 length:729 start_codon:yes stop_codon:yes gene_type:complete